MIKVGLKLDLWCRVLEYFYTNPGCTMFSLSQNLHLSPAQVGILTKILEVKKLISSSKIGRKRVIVVTDNGKLVAEHILEIVKLVGLEGWNGA